MNIFEGGCETMEVSGLGSPGGGSDEIVSLHISMYFAQCVHFGRVFASQ